MKPASYQSMASSVMSPNMTLGHLLSTSNVLQCEKCRFATTDIAAFKKHVALEHTEYYCFYCNSVSLSEAELQAHLKLHTATSPFKCPHCGQVYMRRLCLVKHIERLHSKILLQGPPKFDATKIPHISVSSASQSVPSTESSSLRPVVRVTVPTPTTTGVRLDTNEQRLKTLESRLLNASNGDAVPLNGHVHHNRALTVSLPEEVSIPAGCMVEVVEVKTVDGTKELRLRFVAHQENESVIKNGRTIVPETAKVLSSPPNYQNTIKSSESAMRTVNNKQHETKMVNKERPTLVPVNISKSLPKPTMKEQCRSAKRPSPDLINLNAVVPSKISLGVASSVGDAKGATQKEPVNLNITCPAISSRFANRLTSNLQPENLSTRICLRGVEERKSCIQEHPSSSVSIMPNSIQSTPRIVPMNRRPVTVKAKEDPSLQMKQELAHSQQQSLKTRFLPPTHSLVAPAQVRVTNECKDNFTPKAFFPVQGSVKKTSPEPLPAKKLTKLSNTDIQLSALPQEVKTEKTATEGVRAQREGFPVISSVYSLSQQPDEAQESTQPIVMAEWTNIAGCESLKIKSVRTEQSKIASGYHAHKDSNDGPLTHDIMSNRFCESVKLEQDQGIQPAALETADNIHIKKEKNTPAKENKKCSDSLKDQTCAPPQKPVPTSPLIGESSLAIENMSLQNPVAAKNEIESPSKFLTVSLKRVQVGVWKKSKKKMKPVVSKIRIPVPVGVLRDCTGIQLIPLRKNQAVKRPGPNQPVVVLNHPKPCVHNKTVASNSTFTEACVTPKCQILKIKLSKVGQKYEVMGCTVRNFA